MTDLTGRPREEDTLSLPKPRVGGSRSTLYHLRHRDGHQIPTEVRLNWHVWCGEKMIFALARDVTEQLKADAKLREQAQLIELAPVAIFDLEGKTHYWSKGAERLSGWTAAEVIDQPVRTLFQAKSAVPLRKVTTALRTVGAWEGEVQIVARDGSPQVLYSRAVLYHDEFSARPKVFEIHLDITAQKHAESAALAAEARLKNALSQGGTGTWQWDVIEDRISWDSVLAEILGAVRSASLEDTLLTLHVAEQTKAREAILKAARDGSDLEFDFRVKQRGNLHWFVARGRAERAPNGEVQRISGILWCSISRCRIGMG